MDHKIKKQGLLRLFIQCLSFVFHNGYLRGWLEGRIYTGNNKKFCVPGLNCYSCPGALGACPIGSLQAVLDNGNYKISLYVFGFIGAVGVFCGRFVCGWLCPFGLVQDLLHKIPFPKKVKNLPGHNILKYLRFVILIIFVIILPMTVLNVAGMGQPWFCEYICPSGTLLGGIPLVIANSNLRATIGARFAWKIILLVIVIFSSIASYRPFCKYVCPLGALYGLANPISIYRLKVDTDTCVTCGSCQKACGMDIKVWEKPNSMDCIRCGKCIAACPTGAISSTFSKMTPKKTAEKVVKKKERSELKKKVKKGLFIVIGAADLIWTVVCAQQLIKNFITYVSIGTTDSVATFGMQMAFGVFPFMIIVMNAATIIGMVVYRKNEEQLDEMRTWPLKILKTIPFIVLAEAFVYIIVIQLYYGAGLIDSIIVMPVTMLGGIILWIAAVFHPLILHFIVRK